MDVSYQYLSFFLEDDERLEQIGKVSGTSLSCTFWRENVFLIEKCPI